MITPFRPPEPPRQSWSKWAVGDHLFAPGVASPGLEQAEVLRRVAVAFGRVAIDRPEGDRWVDARIAKAVEIGWTGLLLDAERGLRGNAVLVSVTDNPGPGAAWLQFYMVSDAGGSDAGVLELHYEPEGALAAGRLLAAKIAALLGYEFETADEGGAAEPDAAADGSLDAGPS